MSTGQLVQCIALVSLVIFPWAYLGMKVMSGSVALTDFALSVGWWAAAAGLGLLWERKG